MFQEPWDIADGVSQELFNTPAREITSPRSCDLPSAAIAPNTPRVTTWETSPTIITVFPRLMWLPLDAMTAPALTENAR
jgi:hypothetical protein